MADTTALQAALPDYEVATELGRGAMGIVYLATHRALGRTVAIKELPESFAVDDTVRQRFLSEARVVASLDHPHVVVIYDFVDRDGHLALVMGREHSGLRQHIVERCDTLVSLPMEGEVDSLNVSVATGICLYEALRQRKSAK